MLLINKNNIDNLNRKIIHALSAILICFFPYFFSISQIVFISFLFSFIFLLSKYFDFLPVIKVKRVGLGEVFYPLGVMISALVFLPQGEVLAFQFGILVLGISDALANIFGDLYGFHKIDFYWSKKSLEGSLSFFVSTLLILIFVNFFNFSFSSFITYFILSIVLTFLEFLLFFGLDNLVLPLLSSYLFLVLL